MPDTHSRRVVLVTGAAAASAWGSPSAWPRKAATWSSATFARTRRSAAALAEVGNRGAEVLYCRADVSRRRRPAADMLDAIRERFGRLDVLVNNAGVAPQVRADILEASEESFERLMRINLQGPVLPHPGRGQLDDRAAERRKADAGSSAAASSTSRRSRPPWLRPAAASTASRRPA